MGEAVADALAARGADVVLSYRRSAGAAERAAAAVRARGRRAHTIPADLARAADCRTVVDGAVAALGRLDVIVHMASMYRQIAFDDLDVDAWDAQIASDLRSGYLVSLAAVPYLRAAGGGRIVMVSDWVAASGRPRYRGYVPYYVAKAGVKALAEALALELAGDGILVNAIAPGPILAPPGTSAEEHTAVEQATPLGRWGGPDALARAVVFLCETDFVTGETIRVDGGRHLK